MAARVPSRLRKKIEWLLRRAEGELLPEDVLAGPGAHLDPAGARLALTIASDDVAVAGASERVAALLAATTPAGRDRYVAEHGVCGMRRFEARGASIYQIAVETFPRHVNNVYVVLEGGSSLLFDSGSGLPTSERDMALGFSVIDRVFGETIQRDDVDVCLVSHAHADHWGGVNVLRRTSRASLAVHELDARVISGFEERFILASKDLEVYWRRAGVPPEERVRMREMYESGKRLFRSEKIDRTLRDGDLIGQGYRVHHVPGHCPGLVCLQVHDVLLTSDHVLSHITPHQFPQAITPFAGLEHYFQSLEKIRRVEGIRLALGGHEHPIPDLGARIDEIERFHRARLERTLAICETPRTVYETAREMFGEQEDYGVILAVDEAGAHVEYLHALGRLRVANLDEVAAADDPVIQYVVRGA
jgi:glyoxylase-like metal-dependent hydrolase (beta-lactamase superfamily II)